MYILQRILQRIVKFSDLTITPNFFVLSNICFLYFDHGYRNDFSPKGENNSPSEVGLGKRYRDTVGIWGLHFGLVFKAICTLST